MERKFEGGVEVKVEVKVKTKAGDNKVRCKTRKMRGIESTRSWQVELPGQHGQRLDLNLRIATQQPRSQAKLQANGRQIASETQAVLGYTLAALSLRYAN